MSSFVQPESQIAPDNHYEVVLQRNRSWSAMMSELWCLGTADDYCLHRWHGNPVFELSTRSLFILTDTCTRLLCDIRDHLVSLVEVSGTMFQAGADIWISESYPCDNNEFSIAQAHGLSQQHYTSPRAVHSYHTREQEWKWNCFDICHWPLLFYSEHFNISSMTSGFCCWTSKFSS